VSSRAFHPILRLQSIFLPITNVEEAEKINIISQLVYSLFRSKRVQMAGVLQEPIDVCLVISEPVPRCAENKRQYA
ncbi:MAG: hypothetical protein ACREDS_14005, partial [Limisphaerales bacterium]